jgi:hypothetical protein
LNTTSVYTAAAVFPMLPERLSTDLTSLDPDQDRAAIIVQIDIAADGSVTTSEMYPALVRNRAQLAYGSVGEWLDGHGPAPERARSIAGLADNLRRQDALAQTLRRVRREQGALTLSTREARPVFDGDTVQDLVGDHPNRAKELIEEFMIAANTAMASLLSTAQMPSIRRVVRTPKRWDRIVALAAQTGARLPASPDSQAIAAWLVERQTSDPAGFRDLSLRVVKLVGRGEYIRRTAAATRKDATIVAPRVAAIARRQRRAEIGRERVRQSIRMFEESAERLNVSAQIEIGPIGVHQRARRRARVNDQQDEMQSVVLLEQQIRDEEIWRRVEQMGSRAREVGARGHLRDPGARTLDGASDRRVRLHDKHARRLTVFQKDLAEARDND